MAALWTRLHLDEAQGTIHDGDRRYLMMRPDVLMGMLHELPSAVQVQVLAGFMASACRQGGKSVSAYRDQPGGQGSDALCEVMIDSAASLGWGRWAFRRDGQALMLEVVNSPFAAGHGPSNHAVCAPIAGIFQSLASMVLACDAEVNELACAAQGCQVCHFIAVPTTTADRTVATSKVASAA
jgi:uncharacterized protein